MREGIRDRVAIVGVGCCKCGENWDQAPSDMIVEAAYEAYADAGIDDPQARIDAVFAGSVYSNKGPHEASDALKLWKPVTMVTGIFAPRARLSLRPNGPASRDGKRSSNAPPSTICREFDR